MAPPVSTTPGTEPPPISELKAKRTHARRSCDVCKIRKTRCELPDLEVPSGPTPLPVDKSCHRCKILAIPCVVDDGNKKAKKRVVIEPGTSRKKQKDVQARASPIWNLGPKDIVGMVDNEKSKSNQSLPFGKDDSVENPQDKNMSFHGRPLNLIVAMLGVAYKDKTKTPAMVDHIKVDLEQLIDDRLIAKLEPGVTKLRTLHSYLDTLPFIYRNYRSDPSPPTALLLSLVIYLASLHLPKDAKLAELRTILTPYIMSLRDSIILHIPESFIAIQALEIISLHAPFGVLPVQTFNPRTMAVARGQVSAAVQISNLLRFPAMIKQFFTMHRLDASSHLPWDMGDNWLWLALCATEASVAMESEIARRPAALPDAKLVVDDFLGDNYREVWAVGLHTVSAPELVGHLATCDRIARLTCSIDSMNRQHGHFEKAARDSDFDVVGAITSEMRSVTEQFDAIDARHDAILALISPSSNGIESDWLAYRSVRRRFEANKVQDYGLKRLTAVAYIPGHPLAFPDLPVGMVPVQKVSYAMSRGRKSAEIFAFLLLPNNPAATAVHTWGIYRGKICESTLSAFTEFGWTLPGANSDATKGSILPLHETLCIVVESVKVLMEMQVGAIVLQGKMQLPMPPEVPSWMFATRQIVDMTRNVGSLSILPPTHDPESPVDSLANGCSNILSSMLRMSEDWRRESTESVPPQPIDRQPSETDQSSGLTLSDAMSEYTPGQGTTREYQGENHGTYMNTSDRWMASDHQFHQPVPRRGDAYQMTPTPLDMLLSHMFGYSYPRTDAQSIGSGYNQGQIHSQPHAHPSYSMQAMPQGTKREGDEMWQHDPNVSTGYYSGPSNL